ncbi:prepilin peptidase [Enterovibrio norvegicus FF-33]|uniref:Prepilin peptidase n=1 Tax=Enterovibrio norvegicus FF-454 TaxID=1185651 RepID=A0A1E5CB75_9GAMM|nr:SEC-C metal-binding domain-containing protein [Enterovibrio norvegicus]OEE62739.1 prepilin peptidase [Enterovibrio norvegicus FF-454]OEE70089.1 prepilin peptidase [Enterovibrio norvegicus FF-33]OEE86580.1 prepilin peptidase [Enterovibrio norvegicus FF-162]
MTTLVELQDSWDGMPATFIEGALLAANLSPAPLDPCVWLPILQTGGVDEDNIEPLTAEQKRSIMLRFEQQYVALMKHEYALPDSLSLDEARNDEHQAFAEGFLAVWPHIEPAWREVTVSDGSRRMLSALMTTMLFLHDEKGTLAQMEEAGLASLPSPEKYYQQLPLMINEVALAADEVQQGSGARAVNPYKSVGRNDPCPCGSGKKFKKCCGNK